MASRDPLTLPLATFKDPDRPSWEEAWVGLEPTFQNKKTIRKYAKLSVTPEGEDDYFQEKSIIRLEKQVARGIVEKFEAHRRKKKEVAWCIFDKVKRKAGRDAWDDPRQELTFKWKDKALPPFPVRCTIDPETIEFGIKPVPLAWFYDARFVQFLEELVFAVPHGLGLTGSINHGGGQYHLSAKTYLRGTLLADDIATRLNHPELSCWTMDFPNCDDRSFRATSRRLSAFKDVLRLYRAGAFHPKSRGVLTVEQVLRERWVEPGPERPALMGADGPVGSARDVFQTNFLFGRAVRLRAQDVDPGYWQDMDYKSDGYMPDQIMRYSEGNLNRLQIAGEFQVKDRQVQDRERVPDLAAPVDASMLASEASWETRAQMSHTSARDLVESVLLSVHHARWLEANPGVAVVDELEQDALLGGAEETLRRNGGAATLRRLQKAARKDNLERSQGRVKSDFIEPETLFYAAWKALPKPRKAAIAREAVAGFVERVEQAASADPRGASGDPMEWHRHRVHPLLWASLQQIKLAAGDPVRRELKAWEARRSELEARRPVFSQVGERPPWD